MAEYIDRDAALQELKKMSKVKPNVKGEHTIPDYFSRVATLLIADSYIRNIPAADVQPVKHGRWVFNKPPDDWIMSLYACDQCGHVEEGKPNYCPNCGAKMDGEI